MNYWVSGRSNNRVLTNTMCIIWKQCKQRQAEKKQFDWYKGINNSQIMIKNKPPKLVCKSKRYHTAFHSSSSAFLYITKQLLSCVVNNQIYWYGIWLQFLRTEICVWFYIIKCNLKVLNVLFFLKKIKTLLTAKWMVLRLQTSV